MTARQCQYTDRETWLIQEIRRLTEKHIRLCDQQKRNSPEAVSIYEQLEELIYEFSFLREKRASERAD
jgi:hypothetical protein